MKKRTDQKEDYLKAIFNNDGVRNYVSNKTLAQKLQVSAASVSEMVSKLQKEGYVEYVSYKGVKLNETGIQVTSKLIYNHRIFECFLYQKLNYSLYEVHELAEEIEHLKDDEFFSRLYQFLNRPNHCPHGGVISENLLKSEDFVIPIIQYPEHTEIIIKRFEDNYQLLFEIEKLGLKINDHLQIIDKSIHENQIKIQANQKELKIPIEFAEEIYGISIG